jgi:outer membrane receptor protein involved in Fe transport
MQKSRFLMATALASSTLTLLTQPALAQDAVPQAAEEGTAGDDIIVTGTLIANPNLENSSPVSVIGADEIQLQQANVAEEFLRDVPGVVASIGSQVNNGNGGASTVNLRGIGSNRNLVLLDGSRVTPADLSGVTDLNNIPVALIERVDILTGGASTTYGADAVSGVVNFVTRRNFKGFQADIGTNITEEGDGQVFRVDLTTGAEFEDGRGNAVLALGYQQSDPVLQGDRSFSNTTIDPLSGAAGGSANAVPGVFSVAGVGNRQIDANGNLVPIFQRFNFAPQNLFQTPFERYNIYGQAHYEITSGIEAYTQGLYSRQKVETNVASSAFFGQALTFNVGNPFLPAPARATFCAANGISVAECNAAALTTDPNNPAYREFTTVARRRFVEAGPRVAVYTTNYFNLKAGLRGNITDTLKFDVFGAYGESENIQRQSGNGLLSRGIQALDAVRDASGNIVCRNPTGGCSPLNIFGQAGSISSDALKFIDVSVQSGTFTTFSTVRGVISGDFGFTSPGAETPIGIAVGGEYRRYTASTTSDLASQTPDEVLGNGAASPDSFGKYNVKEFFGELVIPIVEDKPFAKSLTLELGGRYSDYSTSGTSETYKIAGSYEPIEGLKFRGGYNRATRSPNIGELFTPPIVGLDNLAVDPCGGAAPLANANLSAVCIAQGAPASTIGAIGNPAAAQVNVLVAGNPNLDVETADTYTAGLVFQPSFIPGLTLTVDYYDIKVSDAISTPTVGDVIGACFNNITAASATSAACHAISRNRLTGSLDGAAGDGAAISQALSNLGRITTKGFDFTANYVRDLGFAKLNLSFNGNYTDSSKFKATPSGINRECVGRYSVNCSAGGGFEIGSIQPKFSFNQRTTLTFAEKFDVSLLWRHISGVNYEPLALQGEIAQAMADGCADPTGADPDGCVTNPEFRSIGAKDYFDLSFRAEITDKIELTATVQNLFDKKPPIVGTGLGATAFNSGNTYPSTYDPLGRRYAVSARLKF